MSAITGDVGVSPVAACSITEFSLTADSTNVFSTSPQVTGVYRWSRWAVPWTSARPRTSRASFSVKRRSPAQGASINGKLLAQTAVAIDGSAVVEHAP